MGTRTGLGTLKQLGGTLIPKPQCGTQLRQAPRTLATEMRFEMVMRFEARSATLSWSVVRPV